MTILEEKICPFEWRYGSPEMRRLFSVDSIVKTYIKVEVALLKALGEVGLAPGHCYLEVEKCAETLIPAEVYMREQVTGHDIASLAFMLGERCGECGKYVHLGVTSYDVVDTAWALILREALRIVKLKLKRVIERLAELSEKYADVPVVGRTHGQHALPVTFGFKFANYAYELSRSYERLLEVEKRLLRVKMSGSVGTMAVWGEKGFAIEEYVSRELGLPPHLISTQVAPRDGFAELVSVLAILASQLDRFALEVRELSRTEIGEVYEGVERVGSSAMPHKRNPVTAERVSGLAKVVRALVVTALENVPLMHERDLTNSSSERILIPHSILAIDQMLEDTYNMLSNLKVDAVKAVQNLELTRGAIYSELLVAKLVEKGWARHEAYFKVRNAVSRIGEKGGLQQALLEDPELSRYLSPEEVSSIANPEYATRNVRRIIERALTYVRSVLREESKLGL